MNSKQITHRQINLWLAAAMAAPLARAASGCTWLVVLTVGGVILFLNWWLAKYAVEMKEWLVILQGLWASAMISELLWWVGDCWPGHTRSKAAPLILLALAAWSVNGGRERAIRIGCVLIWPIGFLLGAVFLSAVPEIETDHLLPSWQMGDASLIPVMLLPVLYGKKNNETDNKPNMRLLFFAVLVSIVTTGVLSPAVCAKTELVVYELARSVAILGVAERFESVIAAGMTIGYYATISYLLAIPTKLENSSRMSWAYAALGALVYILDLRIDSRALAIGSILLWAILPAVCGIKKFFQNPPETA